jgi:hypothetical protein
LKKTLLRAFAAMILVVGFCVSAFAEAEIRYEYKIVRLGSLSLLQDKDKSETKTHEVEEILNKEGAQGWEVVNIFAVRTTFDPNVFFAAMKRPLAEAKAQEDKP